jgi:subtilase family serine protease
MPRRSHLLPPAAPRRPQLPRNRVRPQLEELERRNLMAVYAPAQLLHAYGFDQASFNNGMVKADGSGQTIAIVDAYNDPSIAGDLQTFDRQWGLPDPVFTKVNQTGGTAYPSADPGWSAEMALDVEWAHAIAPGAGILLVEANSSSTSDLLAGVRYAANQPGVSVVSMSWGSAEFAGETGLDGTFTTPFGHNGVTFVASSGDAGATPQWPAVSPNVVGVGGTSLQLTSSGAWSSETGWGNGLYSGLSGGSGGGISRYESQPSYQQGVVTQSTSQRTSPDVAYNGDPKTGVYVYDSQNGGWFQVGGTSAGAPQWSALIAIADQGRALAGQATLDGPTQTLPALYKMASTDFHDITSGNNGYAATVGYDLVTGRGTPKANLVISDLMNFGTTGLGLPVTTGGSSIGPIITGTTGTPGPTGGLTGTTGTTGGVTDHRHSRTTPISLTGSDTSNQGDGSTHSSTSIGSTTSAADAVSVGNLTVVTPTQAPVVNTPATVTAVQPASQTTSGSLQPTTGLSLGQSTSLFFLGSGTANEPDAAPTANATGPADQPQQPRTPEIIPTPIPDPPVLPPGVFLVESSTDDVLINSAPEVRAPLTARSRAVLIERVAEGPTMKVMAALALSLTLGGLSDPKKEKGEPHRRLRR